MIKQITKKLFSFWINFKESRFGDKLKYLFLNGNSDTLLIVFSGFTPGNERKYNYIKSFKTLKCDKLFILDVYAYRGSYYLFEDGSNYPEEEVKRLINSIITRHSYNKIVTAGSSKGGTAALYFGLELGVTSIFAGACQYNLGTYLSIPQHIDILDSMMGKKADSDEKISILNNKVKDVVRQNKGCKTKIYLLYSKEEPTYEEEIVDLLNDLNENSYLVEEKCESFKEHGQVGVYFPKFVINNI